jgi:hypothetical protein
LQQRFFLPVGLHGLFSFLQRFFLRFASVSSNPANPGSEAAKLPTASPKRRRVQASNRDPSMEPSSDDRAVAANRLEIANEARERIVPMTCPSYGNNREMRSGSMGAGLDRRPRSSRRGQLKQIAPSWSAQACGMIGEESDG